MPFNKRRVGLGLIRLALFAIAIINLFTKQVATISGLIFTAVLFALFTLSEHRSRRKAGQQEHQQGPETLQRTPKMEFDLVPGHGSHSSGQHR